MKYFVVWLIALMCVPASAIAEQWGAWQFGTKFDDLTEKKTTFIQGHGDGIIIQVICTVTKDTGLKNFDGKCYLEVTFKVDEYLGSGAQPPDAIFRIDQKPALWLQLAGYNKYVVRVFSGTESRNSPSSSKPSGP